MVKQNKIIGIIGGMGPFASAYFYKLLLKKSSEFYGAKNNDDFPEILIDSIPVPYFISGTQKLKTATKMLIERVKKMNRFGVFEIGMVCNTGHLLYKELSKISNANFISMIALTAKKASNREYKRVGILATPTTIKFNLYGKELLKRGIKTIYPELGMQRLHEEIIRDVVAGKENLEHVTKLETFTRSFVKENSLDGIILGCTELPLVFPKGKFNGIVIDSMEVLADELLVRYYM